MASIFFDAIVVLAYTFLKIMTTIFNFITEHYILTSVYLFLMGACLGSFINVFVLRYSRIMLYEEINQVKWWLEDKNIVPPKQLERLEVENMPLTLNTSSHCPSCHQKLKAWMLVPIISFFTLKGKCSYCNSPISWQYPAVEFATAVRLMGVYLAAVLLGLSPQSIITLLVFTSLAACVEALDFKLKLVPQNIVIGMGIVGLISYLIDFNIMKTLTLHDAVWGGIFGFVFMVCIFKLGQFVLKRDDVMGEGDIDIAAMLGIFVGIKGLIVTMVLSSLIIGPLLFLFNHLVLKNKSESIPFAPPLIIAATIAMLLGKKIILF